MKNILSTAVFAFLIQFATASFALPADVHLKHPGVLSVCSYSEFTPVSYGQGEGYEADLLRAIAKKWGVLVRFHAQKTYEGLWSEPARASSSCDIAIGGISPMKYREQQGAAFTQPSARFAQSLLVRTEDYQRGAIHSYRDFIGRSYKIGVVPGTTGEIYAHQRAQEIGLAETVFVRYPSEKELLVALKAKKIDAIARGAIGNDYQAAIDPSVTMTDPRDFGEGFAFVVAKQNTVLLQALNTEIATLTQHGQRSYSAWVKDNQVFESNVD